MGENEGELAHAVPCQLGGVEVFDDEYPVAGVEDLGHFEGALRIFGWNRPIAPGVAPGQPPLVLDEPLGDRAARSRLAPGVAARVPPVGSPTGVKQQGV